MLQLSLDGRRLYVTELALLDLGQPVLPGPPLLAAARQLPRPTVAWRWTATSSSTCTTARAGRRAHTRCACRTATAPRRSSSDPQPTSSGCRSRRASCSSSPPAQRRPPFWPSAPERWSTACDGRAPVAIPRPERERRRARSGGCGERRRRQGRTRGPLLGGALRHFSADRGGGPGDEQSREPWAGPESNRDRGIEKSPARPSSYRPGRSLWRAARAAAPPTWRRERRAGLEPGLQLELQQLRGEVHRVGVPARAPRGVAAKALVTTRSACSHSGQRRSTSSWSSPNGSQPTRVDQLRRAGRAGDERHGHVRCISEGLDKVTLQGANRFDAGSPAGVPATRKASRVQQRLKIGVVAPAWFAVPPERYGGIEWVVSLLADGLVDEGHEVVLFALRRLGHEGRARLDVRRAAVLPHRAEHPGARAHAHRLAARRRLRPRQRPLRPARGVARRRSAPSPSATRSTGRSTARWAASTARSRASTRACASSRCP